jgi:hypothetical protein
VGEAYPLFQPTFNRSIQVEARDERLTSDAGLILLREVGERLGIFEWLAAHLDDRRAAGRCEYSLIKLLRTRLVALSAGYTEQSDVERLSHDTAFLLATASTRGDAPARGGRTASQPTLSRLVAAVGDLENVSALRESLAVLAGRSIRASGTPPVSVVLDVDSLPIEVHGHQDLSAYNGHYRYRCFHPLCASLGEYGDITGLWLRGGEVHTAAMADEMIIEAVELVERHIAPVRAVRLDAGFPSEHLLNVFEARGLPYLARLRKNARLLRCREKVHMPMRVPPADEPLIRFEDLEYQAESWSWPRRVVYVHINEPGDMVGRGFFIVTSMTTAEISPEDLLHLYRRRGCAEDAMGQWVRAVRPMLSSASRPKKTYRGRPIGEECELIDPTDANEGALLLSALASNLLAALRRPLIAATGKGWHLDKVRERVCKVGARFTFSGRRVIMAIAGTARLIWRVLWVEIEKIRLQPPPCPDG